MKNQALDSIIAKIEDKIERNERITEEEALWLFIECDLSILGYLANRARFHKHPEKIVTFLVDRNINYTNECVSRCKFCAFWKERGYIISKEEIFSKIEEALSLGATSILFQGGLNPKLGLAWFEDIFKSIKEKFPNIHIHGLSAPEIVFLSMMENLTIEEVLIRLKNAGLDTIPGGGAEILSQRVRELLSPKKCTKDEWLHVMEVAHSLGIRSSATMMAGHIEKPEDVVEHLSSIRKLQDKTRGFTAFIPWIFQPKNTQLEHIEKASGAYYLRILALSRIFLDNFENIQVSWVTQGGKFAQIGLFFGANDFGSLMIEENVVKAAGVSYRLKLEEILNLIREAGFKPAKRNILYEILEVY
ncbi:MAG: cyclic dehypoxanthinyl futalosine synthase [Thermosulfidibacteraceae bacterium]|jgi:cyclic dehypoxanthinyl futalosine synthase